MTEPNAGISRATAGFSERPVCVWYCPLKWMSSGAWSERTSATLSMRSTSCGKSVRDRYKPFDTSVTSRSLGVQRVSLKSQVSIGLMAPPSSMKMQLRAVPRGVAVPCARTSSGHTRPSTHELASATPPHFRASRRVGIRSLSRRSMRSLRPSAADQELGAVEQRPQQIFGAAAAVGGERLLRHLAFGR